MNFKPRQRRYKTVSTPQGDVALILKPRPHGNTAEAAFVASLGDRWTPTKRGWPDFFCISDTGEVMVVEVKKDGQPLRSSQVAVMAFLSAAGIKCYTWTPSGGLKPFGRG